jgi:apolipoprotein D and lipocalin family protein
MGLKDLFLPWLATVVLSACTSVPDGIEPVSGLDLERYLGTWHEIARLDHRFERGKTHVSASYSLRSDGGIQVLNRGYSLPKASWGQADGRAYSVGAPEVGHLKVSFFGPFYGSYVIFELDHEAYQYAFVCGPDRDYLWLLARSPDVPDELRERFQTRASELGFATDRLIWVDQARPVPISVANRGLE